MRNLFLIEKVILFKRCSLCTYRYFQSPFLVISVADCKRADLDRNFTGVDTWDDRHVEISLLSSLQLSKYENILKADYCIL